MKLSYCITLRVMNVQDHDDPVAGGEDKGVHWRRDHSEINFTHKGTAASLIYFLMGHVPLLLASLKTCIQSHISIPSVPPAVRHSPALRGLSYKLLH